MGGRRRSRFEETRRRAVPASHRTGRQQDPRAQGSEGDEAGARITRSILYLAEHMAEVPVIVLPCYDVAAAGDRYGTWLGSSAAPTKMEPGMYASIYPAVWSFQLALRSRGLGSAMTTAHQLDQPAMAEILGIPSTWDQTCLIPVAYTIGGDFKPSPRRPVTDSIIWNRPAPGTWHAAADRPQAQHEESTPWTRRSAPGRFEPTHPAPEGGALSPELRGRVRPSVACGSHRSPDRQPPPVASSGGQADGAGHRRRPGDPRAAPGQLRDRGLRRDLRRRRRGGLRAGPGPSGPTS